MANLLQNLANGVRAAFPSTPAPTNTTLAASQKMPGTGSANTNAQNTVNTLFGKTQTSTPTTAAPVQTPPAGFNPITTGGDISKAPAAYSGGSVVDYLNSKGQASDYGSRSKLAAQYGISGYGGTAEQNTALLNALRNGTQSSQAASNTQTTQSSTPTNTQASQSNSTPSTTTPAVTYTSPQTQAPQVPQTQPQGNVGQGQDMTYGGLIQESLRKQQETADRVKGMQNELANTIGQVENRSIPLEFKTGREQVLQNLAGQRIANEQANLANQASIYGKAISAMAPTTQFGQLTDPTTGLPITGGAYGSNPQLQNAVGLALQLVASGADPKDSQVQNLISTFGMPGQALFTQGMQAIANGTYNPTAFSSAAQSSASQGTGYKESAVALDTALKQLEPTGTMAVDFLNKVKEINPSDSSILNTPVNKYIGDVKYSGAVSQYSAILGDIKKFTSQILASNNGTIPTDVTNTLSTFDPTNLSASQLKPYLDTLKELGQNQLAIIQGQASNLGVGGYMGNPASVTTSTTAAPAAQNAVSGLENPIAQGVTGFGMTYIPTILDKLVSFTGGAITGLASKILK